MLSWIAVYGLLRLAVVLAGIPPENYYNYGIRLAAGGAHARAEAAFSHAFSAPALAGRAYYNAGNAAYQRGDFSLAIRRYEQSLEFDPQDPDAWNNLNLALKKNLSPDPAGSPQAGGRQAAGLAGRNQQAPGSQQKIQHHTLKPEIKLQRFFQPNGQENSMAGQAGGKDIFSQSPDELLQTLREQTRAEYPFQPRSSLVRPTPVSDEVDW